MPRPGDVGGIVPPGDDWVAKRLADLQRQIDGLTTARSLRHAVVDAGGLQSGDFDGDLATNTLGTAGWGLSGATGVGIFNALLLRTGSVAASALASPVLPAYAHTDAASFTVSTVLADVATVDITPPSGYTRALVYATATAAAQNSTATLDQLGVNVTVGGVTPPGYTAATDVSPGGVHSTTRSGVVLLTGITPIVPVTVTVQVRSYTAGWASSTWNTAQVDALALFLA